MVPEKKKLEKTLGKNVQRYRNELQLSTGELAELSGLPIEAIEAIESSERYRMAEIDKVATALGTDMVRILEGDGILVALRELIREDPDIDDKLKQFVESCSRA
ncbi:MAG: helix-turn-helix transcriptional regulator [Candidatus Moranbacteria bacterium]|nr:helix-turn-helix transcriptional regulator [Candidatus Moranbacteria bacterium]NTW45645.1 helix-turn-helix transcriptional regulator [Candidatus Moranbacteria bacterium]